MAKNELKHVKAPVNGIKQKERPRKHNSSKLVDAVNVLDFWQVSSQRTGSLLQALYNVWFSVPIVVPVAMFSAKTLRIVGSSFPERWWEVQIR